MSAEKKRILDMLAEGKINAEESMLLLDQLDSPEVPGPTGVDMATGERMLRVRIYVKEAQGEAKDPVQVNVNLPLKVARAAGKLISSGLPAQARDAMEVNGIDLSSLNWGELIDALADTGGDIVNITQDGEDNQVMVRVYVE